MPRIVETTTAGLQAFDRDCRSLLSCIRLGEVLILQGMPLLGALFAMGHPTAARCLTAALLTGGSLLLTAHVFVLNDWTGADYDLRDPNRLSGVFTNKGTRKDSMAYLAAILLLGGLLLLLALGSSTLAIGAGIAATSALYSLPCFHGKGVPIVSSVLHFCGGLLQFLLGYSIYTALDWRGVQIGSYFALVFMAGHLTHETRDSDSDRQSDIRTNAVVFGKERTFVAGFILFAVADVILARLVLTGAVPGLLSPLLALFPLHVYWTIQSLRAGLTFRSVRRLQWQYRGLYAVKGVWIGAVLLFQG